MASDRRNRSRHPARRAPTLNPRRRLLVVCEGTRSEPEYLHGFIAHAKNPLVDVAVDGKGADPQTLVETAKRLKEEADADARRRRDDFLRFDEVWCAFDRDEHAPVRVAAAFSTARGNQIQVAHSNPCFEFWLLLHFRDSPGMRHRDAVRRMLENHVHDYDKGVDFAVFQPGLADATRRAKKLDEDAEAMQEAHRNPTTGFYQLTDSIARREGRP